MKLEDFKVGQLVKHSCGYEGASVSHWVIMAERPCDDEGAEPIAGESGEDWRRFEWLCVYSTHKAIFGEYIIYDVHESHAKKYTLIS